MLGSAGSWDLWGGGGVRTGLGADSIVQRVTGDGAWGPRFLDPSGLGLGFEDLLRGRGGEVEDRTVGSEHNPGLESPDFEMGSRQSLGLGPLGSSCLDARREVGLPGWRWEGGISPTRPASRVPSYGLGLADPLWLSATTPPCPSPAAESCKAEGCYQGHAEICWAA